MMLRHPSGAVRRCDAHKRWALVRVRVQYGVEPRMDVLFRTSDSAALTTRGHREANKAGANETIGVFRLTDGLYLGPVYPKAKAPA
jgi:hypothetical protein